MDLNLSSHPFLVGIVRDTTQQFQNISNLSLAAEDSVL